MGSRCRAESVGSYGLGSPMRPCPLSPVLFHRTQARIPPHTYTSCCMDAPRLQDAELPASTCAGQGRAGVRSTLRRRSRWATPRVGRADSMNVSGEGRERASACRQIMASRGGEHVGRGGPSGGRAYVAAHVCGSAERGAESTQASVQSRRGGRAWAGIASGRGGQIPSQPTVRLTASQASRHAHTMAMSDEHEDAAT